MSRTANDIELQRRPAVPFWRRLDLPRTLVVTTVITIAAAGLQMAFDLRQQRAAAEAAALASVRNLSLALARDIELTTSAIDNALVTMASEIAATPDGVSANNPVTRAILQRNRALLQDVRGVFLNDATGLVVEASNPQAGAVLLGTGQADRPYFSSQRDGLVSGLFIGAPVVSRLDGTPIMTLTRRIDTRDGAFAGVVGATISVFKLEDFYSRFDIPSSMVMSLWLSTGELVARRPAASRMVGQSVVNSVVPTLRASGTAATVVYGESPVDGVTRLSVFRNVANYPFVVGSAIAETDFLAAWRREVLVSLMQLTIGGSFLLGVSILLAAAIRRRERLVDQLRESENRFRDFAEIASDWLCELDSRLRFSYISARPEQLTGESPDRLLGRTPFEVVPHADVDEQRETYAEHRADLEARREIRNFQFRATLADGQMRWVTVSARPVFDPKGEFAGYRGAVTDRTPQVVAEREALDATVRLKSAIESLPDGFAMFAGGDRLVQCNTAFTNLTGCRVGSEPIAFADFIRFLADHVVLPDALGATRETWMAEIARRHREPQDPFDIHFKDGRWIRIIEARTHEGGSVLLHADVTARRQAEDALARAQKLDALGQLTGGVAHDFNNLLTVIIGEGESLVDELATLPVQVRGANAIVTAALRGADLTRQLLAFARRQPLQLARIDANALLAELKQMLRRTLTEAIEIRVVAAPGLWTCLADRAQLENTMLNLAINARDAMPAGGVLAIETANVTLDPHDVALYPDAAAGEHVMVAVSDSGEGMPPEVLERVFEPFFTTKPAGQGTGLGLSMVYGFVKQCGGHIRIYSELGHGTTVKIYLRRADRANAEKAAPSEEIPQGKGETILIVEDDDMVRETTVTRIQHLGYKVLTAINGPAALKLLDQNTGIDLLLTDMVMPGGMTGLDLALAARERRPDLKVLITSGYAASAMAGYDAANPPFEMIGKPYRASELAQRLREALRGERHAD